MASTTFIRHPRLRFALGPPPFFLALDPHPARSPAFDGKARQVGLPPALIAERWPFRRKCPEDASARRAPGPRIAKGSPERGALAALSLTMGLASLGTSIVNVGLPTVARSFHASFQSAQWIVLAYLLATTTLVVGAGRLGDLFGRRRLLLVGLGSFTLAALLGGIAPTLPVLIATRTLQGLGAALMMALALALVSECVPQARTGRAMGLLGSLSAVGTAVGPSLGGMLLERAGWASLFFVQVPVGLLALVLARRYLPGDRRPPGDARVRFDLPGTLLLAMALAGYALAVTTGRGGLEPLGLGWLSLGLVGAGALVWVESRTASPLISLATFRDPALRSGFATSALVSTVVMATLVVGPFYLAFGLALDATAVGAVMAIGPAVAALSGPSAGRLVDRHGSRAVVIAGLVAMAGGCAILALAPRACGIPGYLLPLALLTAGYGVFQAANTTAVMMAAGPGQRGVVSGALALSRNLGLITGASVMGAVFARGLPGDLSSASPEALAAGMRATFLVATVLVVVTLGLARAGTGRPSPLADPSSEP